MSEELNSAFEKYQQDHKRLLLEANEPTAAAAHLSRYDFEAGWCAALSRPAPAVQVPEGASVSTDVEYMRVNGMFELSVCVTFPPMTDADANAYGYSQRDALAKSLRAMLATPATVATEAVAQGGGVEWRRTAERVLAAWYSTVLPVSRDGMMQERMEELRALLASAPAVPVGDGWVKVSERLPVINGAEYVGVNEFGRKAVFTDLWRNGDSLNAYHVSGDEDIAVLRGVVKWMPLPPAPAVDGEG